MKKLILGALSVVAAASLGAAIGCSKTDTLPAVVVNGGFESADLSGWTVEYGDAYDDDSVSSRKTFSYSADVDPHGYVIPVNQTGNWYLSGKGFDNNRPSTCTGAIRSQNFVLSGDGTVSLKLAGGAQVTARSDTAARKSESEICFVGIYRASDDKMIARQANDYFAEDASNIELVDYENGTCFTDNFCQYTIELSEYIGEELYIRIVDNDTSYYYGYLSVDDIRIGKTAEAQSEGAYFAKSAERKTATPATEYDIANGDFETGNLAGWEVTEGLAFSDDGVNGNPYWWAEQIPYEREGSFHYGYYNPTAVGRMRSTTFTVGGTGYVTYKLGGCADNNTAYLRFVNADSGEQVLKVSNSAFKDMQFPNVQNGMRVLNMNQYRLNLSQFLGEKLYIEAVDENASDNMAGCIVLDSVKTYHTTVPQFTDWFDVEYEVEEVLPDSRYQVKNGGFENGYDGWTMSGNIGEVTSDDTWWKERLPYNKSGKNLFSGINNEGGKGSLTSEYFTVGGSGLMTFKFGGAPDPRFCYISLIDRSGNTVAKYGNHMFHIHGDGLGAINRGTNIYNMVTYRADISKWAGQELCIRIVDDADSNYGLVTVDSFVTYYEDADVSRFPANSVEAINLIDCKNPEQSEYQIPNGSFENGNLDGWTAEGNIGNVSYDYLWWNEWYTFNKDGLFFFSGFAGNEAAKGTLTSSAFTVGGSGMITYRLGGGMDSSLCYIDIIDADNPDVVYYRFGNEAFTTKGGVFTGSPIIVGCDGFGAKMVLYKVDLSKLLGKRVKLRLVDNAAKDWGLLFADDFVTYYGNEAQIPYGAVQATNILPVPEFEDVDLTLNFAYGQNSLTLRPKANLNNYAYEFDLAEEYEGVTVNGNVLTVSDNANTYEISIKARITFTLLNETTERTFKVKLSVINDERHILNGNFETGDLTGWTVVSGNVHEDSAIEREETFFDEQLPFNKEGKFHFDGWGAQYAEAETYALRSETFTLGGSGFISFKMAGRAAVLKVFKADGTQIAEYENTQFADVKYPHIDEGSRQATMVTFVADLSEYIGEKLYIEICDGKEGGNWGVAFFDDIVTYYETAPDVENSKDIVHLNPTTSKTETECDYELNWVTAINKIQ